MPPSSEFVTLCRSQVALLTNSLGAAVSIVYLTEELMEASNAKLVPLVAYPETVTRWKEDRLFTLLSQGRSNPTTNQRLLISQAAPPQNDLPPVLPQRSEELDTDVQPLQAAERALMRQQQVMMPLIHEEVVMGLLVTAREDRAWNEAEQTQIQQISETLALACFLDQRSQWLAQDLRQQRLLREQRQDILDDLMHQFRNPLTALRTFGKLLIKRLRPGDNNRTVAEGIVRESDRLQELLQQIDRAIDLDDTEFRRLLNAIESGGFESEGKWVKDLVDISTTTDAAVLDASLPAPSSQPRTVPLLPGTLFGGEPFQIASYPLTEILDPLLESASAIAQDRQLQLQIQIPADLPAVQIDSRAIREVVSNLIDNALKYTPTGGIVYVGVRSQPSSAHPHQQALIVADTGPGIPPEDLMHLFERHYRGVQANTSIPGTGLGLAIARDLIQQMQGEIQVFSPASSSSLVPPLDSAFSPSTHPGTAVVVWLAESEPASGSVE